jgi:hypothetical protein
VYQLSIRTPPETCSGSASNEFIGSIIGTTELETGNCFPVSGSTAHLPDHRRTFVFLMEMETNIL